MIVLAEVLAVAAARDGVRVCAHGALRVVCGLRRRQSCCEYVLCCVCAAPRARASDRQVLISGLCALRDVRSHKILQQWYEGGLCELLANRGLPARVN